MRGGGIGTAGRAGAARSVGWSSQLPGRSAWLRGELGSRSRDTITSAGSAGSTVEPDQECRGEAFNCRMGC